MTTHAPGIPHPRIAARRAAVDAAVRAETLRRRRVLWLLLAGAFVVLCGYLVTRSEVLDVDRVTVRGTAQTPAAEVISAAGIKPGQPLVGLDLQAARERISRLPWVEEVYSTRHWNGSVRFSVSERTPAATLAVPGGWALTDARGRILSVTPEAPAGAIPIVGLNIAGAAPGDWLDAPQRGLVDIVVALEDPVRSLIRAVQQTPAGVVAHLHVPGRVLLGDGSEIAAKWLALRTIVEQVDLRCLDVLNLGSPGTPVLTRATDCS